MLKEKWIETDGYLLLYPARKQGADSHVYLKLSFGN